MVASPEDLHASTTCFSNTVVKRQARGMRVLLAACACSSHTHITPHLVPALMLHMLLHIQCTHSCFPRTFWRLLAGRASCWQSRCQQMPLGKGLTFDLLAAP